MRQSKDWLLRGTKVEASPPKPQEKEQGMIADAIFANPIRRALDAGIPKLIVFGDTAAEIVLHKTGKGGVISDPDCDRDYEALEAGVFFRARVERNGAPAGHRWLRLCGSDDLWAILKDRAARASLPEFEIQAAGLDASWQLMQWQDAKQKSVRREKNRAPSTRRP
jgi:hypothetical protein